MKKGKNGKPHKSIILYENEVSRISKFITKRRLTKFYEPVSLIEQKGKNKSGTLIVLSPDLLNSWICHASNYSYVKMTELEAGILSEIKAGRIINAMTLIRAHFEAAGLACLCLQEFHKWFRTGNIDSLRTLIPNTFLGTSMVRASKKFKNLDEMLRLSEQDKLAIGSMISAFDQMYANEETPGVIHGYYGVLCEFAHPNLRSLRSHIRTVWHRAGGWSHVYQKKPNLTDKDYIMMFDLLLISMKVGHAAAEIFESDKS